MRPAWLAVALVAPLVGGTRADPGELRVGVTLPAYYSWCRALTRGVPAAVVPLLPEGADIHAYQPTPDDLRRLEGIDLLVCNGLGHDDSILRLLASVGRAELPRVDLHRDVPRIPYDRGRAHTHGADEDPEAAAGATTNPHTFLSLTGAIHQVYNLERALAERLPAHAVQLRTNARDYARRLRVLRAETAARLKAAPSIPVATVHDGYAYLLQEFGLRVAHVVQPRHGLRPSASELVASVAALKEDRVRVLFAERDMGRANFEELAREAGVRLFELGHVGGGTWSDERFEVEMRANCETLVAALTAGP